jgi:hypothetical protein
MTITVKDLIGRGRVLAGTAGIKREVTSPQISRPELTQWCDRNNSSASVSQIIPGDRGKIGPGWLARSLCNR